MEDKGVPAQGGGEEEDPFEIIWGSYLPDDKRVSRKQAQQQQTEATLLEPPIDQTKLSGVVEDGVWLGTNQAMQKLVKRTVQAPAPVVQDEMTAIAEANKKTHQIRKLKYKRQPASTSVSTTTTTTTTVDAPNGPPSLLPAAQMEAVVAPALAPLQIETLEQHKLRNKQTELFALTIERQHQTPTTEMIISTPPAVTALQYCATLPAAEVPWYEATKQAVASRTNMTFPKTPLMSRSVLLTFLRQPDAHNPYERPCLNLDRNPYEHERGFRMRCVAHRMSAEQLGEANAFRCRELLYHGQMIKINAALASKGAEDPRLHLHDIPELCYMCHVWLTTEAALAQRNKASAPTADDMLVIFNRFMVMQDVVGEYARHAMLCSEDVAIGIWGPFPRWNERHYKAVRLNGNLYGFEEAEEMLFRQARKSSSLSDGVVAKATDAIHSDPTVATRTAASSFPQ